MSEITKTVWPDKQKKILDRYVFGIQYYRAPTPLPEEWAEDLEQIKILGLNAVQIRVQWRWNERREGEYDFSDVDRLFDMAEKSGQNVIIKFMLETAPDYIFRRYHGSRCDMNGKPLRAGGHGAFYIGGWWPCFDNPEVMERAQEFVRVCVRRYCQRENLLLWNIWNEPRVRPIGDCGCPDSIQSYHQYLCREYGSIETYNDRFGKCYEDFSTIEPPAMPYDYVDLFVWRRWAAVALAQRLRSIYRTVREIDSRHPVISHAGVGRIQQDAAADVSDDFANAAEVDFYGTSFGVMNNFTNCLEESMAFLLCDWQRAVNPYFWVYELYPEYGSWFLPATIYDFKFRLWAAIAGGCKGIMMWQYRAERVGCESDQSGLVNIDGSPKMVTPAAAEAARWIKDHEEFLLQSKVKEDGVAILYDSDSDLINRVEHTGCNGDLHNFDLDCPFPYPYKKSVWGIYALFRELGIQCRVIDSRHIRENLQDMKLLYIPEGFLLTETHWQEIRHFAEAGGQVIAEEGFMLRDAATWVRPDRPPKFARHQLGAVMGERVYANQRERSWQFHSGSIPAGAFATVFTPADGAAAVARWENGEPAAIRNGNYLLLGTSLGVSFYEHYTDNPTYRKILRELIAPMNIGNELPLGVSRRTLISDDRQVDFYFNSTSQHCQIAGINLPPREVTRIEKDLKN